MGFGFVQDWIVLIPLRLLLGLFEAGCEYPRKPCILVQIFEADEYRLSWSGVPDLNLVREVRYAEALRCLLLPRSRGVRMFWDPRIRASTDGTLSRLDAQCTHS